MQWSKLKSRLMALVDPGVGKRIDFHLMTYRKLSELASEFIVTVDGHKVFGASATHYNRETYVTTRWTGLVASGDGHEPRIVEQSLIGRNVLNPADITSSIRTYLDLDPKIALCSSDPVLKALAVIDRRTGRRTLNALEMADDEHALVRALYLLRMESMA